MSIIALNEINWQNACYKIFNLCLLNEFNLKKILSRIA